MDAMQIEMCYNWCIGDVKKLFLKIFFISGNVSTLISSFSDIQAPFE